MQVYLDKLRDIHLFQPPKIEETSNIKELECVTSVYRTRKKTIETSYLAIILSNDNTVRLETKDEKKAKLNMWLEPSGCIQSKLQFGKFNNCITLSKHS